MKISPFVNNRDSYMPHCMLKVQGHNKLSCVDSKKKLNSDWYSVEMRKNWENFVCFRSEWPGWDVRRVG